VIELAGAIALVILLLLPFGLLLGIGMLGGALTPRAKRKFEIAFCASYGVIVPCAAAVFAGEHIAKGEWTSAAMWAGMAAVAIHVAVTGALKGLKALKAFEGEKA
jgi:hypothetical protein